MNSLPAGTRVWLAAGATEGLASSAIPDKVNDPIAVAAQWADAGFRHLT